MHFDVPGCDFGVPGHHCVDPKAPNDTTGHLGGQTWISVHFPWILGAPCDQLWNHVGDFFVGPPTGSTDSIVVFLLIWEQTWHQNATPGCLQNIVNTMVFVRFTVWDKIDFEVSHGRLWALFWQAFGDPGLTFSRFLGYRKEVGFFIDFRWILAPWGHPVPSKFTRDHAGFGGGRP